MQTVASVEETKEFLAVAGTGGRVAGVVGWVDLTVADVADAVAALQAAPGGEVLVGIRHQVHDEPDPAWLVHGEVLAGLAAVAEAGLAYDLLVRERGAAGRPGGGRAASAARRLSSTTWPSHGFVRAGRAVGHCARALARLPNVTCKVSGLVTEADWTPWTSEQLVRYAGRRVRPRSAAVRFRLAGVPAGGRLRRGGDGGRAGPGAAGLDAAERDLVFGANARRVYRLPEPTDDHGG